MKPKTILNSWQSCLYLPSARPACQFQLLSCLFLSQIWPASFDRLLSRVFTLLLDRLLHWNSFLVSVSSLGSPAQERSSHTILPLFLRMYACLMTFRLRTSDSQNFTPENSLRARFKVRFSPRRQLRFHSGNIQVFYQLRQIWPEVSKPVRIIWSLDPIIHHVRPGLLNGKSFLIHSYFPVSCELCFHPPQSPGPLSCKVIKTHQWVELREWCMSRTDLIERKKDREIKVRKSVRWLETQ